MGWTGNTADVDAPGTNQTYSFCGFLLGSTATNSFQVESDSRGFQAGTLKQMQVRIIIADASTFTYTINGTSTTHQTVSGGPSATGLFIDNTHSDTTSGGENVDVIETTNSNNTISLIGFTFTATTAGNTATRLGFNSFLNSAATNTSYFQGFGAIATTASGQTTEADAKMRMRKTFTIKNMGGKAFGSTSTLTVSSRKNGANGAISATTGGGGPPSSFSDASHSDSVVSGDDWNITFKDTTNAPFNFYMNIDVISTNGDCPFFCGNTSLTSLSTAVTTYFGLTGSLATTNLQAEGNTQVQVNSAFVFTNLLINTITNGNTGTSTFSLRANGADVISISIGGTTGIHLDSSSQYQSATSDLMNYKIVTGSTGSTMTISQMSVNGNIATQATSGPSYQHFDNGPPLPLKKKQNYNSFGGQLTIFG